MSFNNRFDCQLWTQRETDITNQVLDSAVKDVQFLVHQGFVTSSTSLLRLSMAPPQSYSTAAEYLHNVLSQRGPDAVPYAEFEKGRIREHVSELQDVSMALLGMSLSCHTELSNLFSLLWLCAVKANGTFTYYHLL